jgi:flagellin-like hook-associated protein FlgL
VGRLHPHDERADEACDDAAGLGIAVNLQSDIGKYEQASREANDGLGGLEELEEKLSRLALELEETR